MGTGVGPAAPKSRDLLGSLGCAQVVDFVQHRRRGEIVVDDLRVGHVSGVIEREPPAEADHPARQFRFTQNPAGHVDFMHALIAGFAVPFVPRETAVVLQALR